MTHAQRALILAALGLTPRDGVMPRWSSGNLGAAYYDDEEISEMCDAGWLCGTAFDCVEFHYHVTRRGAEAAGVLGRCRREHLS